MTGHPFAALNYGIVYRPLGAPNEVRISAPDGLPLRVGDNVTVCDQRFFYDLVVEGVRCGRAGDWSALCGVVDRQWL